MCGICGIAASEPDDLRRVADAQEPLLTHRGPDSYGAFEGSKAAIAQNRLAIIDLVTGDPPITNEDRSIGVVLNGEIYNFPELTSELRARGHEFHSHGDTEVIAHLAEDCKPAEIARRLHGMFAFAIWDDRRGRLVLGRDRVGKKPLYYWATPDRLVFASEIKALFADPAVPRELDPSAIPAYLTFGYVPSPRTFYRGIRSVPPGHVLTFEPGSPPVLERYWQPPLVRDDQNGHLGLSADDAARQVRTQLEAAVERRLVSDVPLGAFLSGGIDSSAVVAVMASLVDRPVETFTIGFDDQDGFDERPYARLVADRYRTSHHEYVVHPDAVDLVERLVWHHDQPFGDSSAVPTYLLSQVTRGEVTVALSGDGGDEVFAGYERFAAGIAAQRYATLPRLLRTTAERGVQAVPATAFGGRGASVRRFAEVARRGLPDAYRSWVSYVKEPEWDALTAGGGDTWALDDYRALWESSEGAHPLDRLLDLNIRTYLPDDLLVKVDRMSMAHGLEVRCPFLDQDLIEFAAKLPPRLKLRGMSLKRILKQSVQDLLPSELLDRPKKGFGVPLDRWFREDLRDYVAGTLGADDARVKRYLVGDAVDRMIAQHQAGERNHGGALWTLLTLEVFLRREGW
jgi:asparagine synthase (glutamine-hydrolysing)